MGAAVRILCLVLGWCVAFGAFCGQASSEETRSESLKRVAFLPQWQPQAQFAGYYVAQDKGFYARRGLDVNVLQGGPNRAPAEWLRKGAAQFGTLFLSTAIVERSRGTRLLHLGQIVQKSSQLLIARKSSGVRSLQDLDGRRVGLWGAELSLLPLAAFRRLGVRPVIVPQASTVNLFLRGGVDVVSAMAYNEYHTLLTAGLDPEELVVFRLTDSIAFPEDGLYCLEETFHDDPKLCRDFVQASLEGWRHAFEHEEEALDSVMKRVDEAQIPTNRVHQKWMLAHIRELIQPSRPGEAMGSLAEADYLGVAEALRTGGLTDRIPPWSEFHVECVQRDER